MPYVTVVEFRAYARTEIAVDEALLQSVLDAASEAIDDYCQRTFALSESASERLFAGRASSLLPIHDAVSVASVVVDGATLPGSSWQAEPLNGIDGSGRQVPVSTLRRLDGIWQTSTPGEASISVTATWGWPAVPAPVKAACRIIASEILDERNRRGGLVDFGDFAGRAVASRNVSMLLGPLRSPRAWGIA